MSRAHARMRSRLGRAGVLDNPVPPSEYFLLAGRLRSLRRTRKAVRARLKANRMRWIVSNVDHDTGTVTFSLE